MKSADQTYVEKKTKLPDIFLTGYFVSGHPNQEQCIELITSSVEAGLDAVEIGIPSEDPFLDGEVIKRAHQKVLPYYQKFEEHLSFIKELRKKISTPIWVMGYYKDLMKDELYRRLAEEKLIDGYIIPDLKRKDLVPLQEELKYFSTALIPVVNDSMSDEELSHFADKKELLYCALYSGKTGKSISNFSNLPSFHQRVRNLTNAKLMGGFGIKNKELVQQVYDAGYDGAVVGSEIVRLVEEGTKEELLSFIRELASSKKRKGE